MPYAKRGSVSAQLPFVLGIYNPPGPRKENRLLARDKQQKQRSPLLNSFAKEAQKFFHKALRLLFGNVMAAVLDHHGSHLRSQRTNLSF